MLKTFRLGGIHPQENKLSAGKKIETLPTPGQIVIPLSQHIGAPAVAVVQKGDAVKAGTLIAKANGFVSAGIHSSVSGIVVKIDDITDASGYRKPAVFIKVEGDEPEPFIDQSPGLNKNITLSSEEIIRKIADAGIVGMGGATFPTHIKLTPPSDKTAQLLIINGVECEPYLTSDHALMLEKGNEIMVGTQLLMRALKVKRAVIGIENNKKDAIVHLSDLSKNYDGIKICPLKVKYPQGSEKQLVDAVIKRRIGSGKLPIEVGAVVQNVGTAFAVYEAVQKNKPLFERIVTVTGKGIKNPSNYRVKIGTPVNELITAAGGISENTGKIVGGGPMMGKALVNAEVPVTKGCSGILVLPGEETARKERRNCIRCSKCVSVCPMGLSPYLLMTVSEFSVWDKAKSECITDCIECGSCSYTCPANRPLLDYIRLGKNKVQAHGVSRIV
ncbi:MAG: electron transport complex subunit RsxC [Candidatus Azobacteroides sp.]|nr:electron transport complex subunit RsxC [Candidatus Azobacteroides sp.]